MKVKTKSVAVKNISVVFYVRESLHESRVEEFVQILQGGGKLPPLEITPNNELIEGRHRLQAHTRIGTKKVECVVVNKKDRSDLILHALKANLGGPLPPTPQDLEHTIILLFDQKLSRPQVLKRLLELTSYPQKFLVRLLDNAQAEVTRRRVKKAIAAVAQGNMTVTEAAKKFEVSAGRVRTALGGSRKRDEQGIPQINSGISSRFQAHNITTNADIRSAIKRHEEGEFAEADVLAIFKHLSRLIEREKLSCEEKRKRFLARPK